MAGHPTGHTLSETTTHYHLMTTGAFVHAHALALAAHTHAHAHMHMHVHMHSLSGQVGGVGGQGGKGGERGTVRPPSPLLRMGAEVALQTGSMASVPEVGSRVRAL